MGVFAGLCAIVILSASGAQGAPKVDIRDVLERAAGKLASDQNTQLQTTKGTRGLCVSYEDATRIADCDEQTVYLSYEPPVLEEVYHGERGDGQKEVRVEQIEQYGDAIRVEAGRDPQTRPLNVRPKTKTTDVHLHCEVGFTSPLELEVNMGRQDIADMIHRAEVVKFDFSTQESTRLPKLRPEEIPQETFTVQPGECKSADSSEEETIKELHIPYHVDINGNVAVFFTSPVGLKGFSDRAKPLGAAETATEANAWEVPVKDLLRPIWHQDFAVAVAFDIPEEADKPAKFRSWVLITDIESVHRVDVKPCACV